METKIVAGFKVTTFRKNNTKLVLSMRDMAIKSLESGKNLKEISDEMQVLLYGYTKKKYTSTYISYYPIKDWNKKESLSIRNSSMDNTLVSFTKEEEE